jgi:hypothetical protein
MRLVGWINGPFERPSCEVTKYSSERASFEPESNKNGTRFTVTCRLNELGMLMG